MPFGKLPLEAAPEIALHRGRADSLPPPQAAAVNAIQVLTEDHLLERFTGPLVRLHPWKPLAKMPAELQTAQLATL